jgi:hypothetical protein
MRHPVVIEGAYAMLEDFAYSLGDAEDWLRRNQADFSDWADAVAFDGLSAQEMKRRMNEQFAHAFKQIAEARQLVSSNGQRIGFSHLHESLLPEQPVIPLMRIVKPLPTPEEGA